MLKVLERLNLKERWSCLVVAMSTSRQIVTQRLNDLNIPYDLHICKYILYSNKDHEKYKNHWEGEIFDFLDKAQSFKFKGTNKKPDAYFLKEWFFTIMVDDYASFIRMLNSKERECMRMNPPYPKRTKDINLEKAWKKYQKFMDLCAKDMATGDLTEEKMRKYIQPLHKNIN